jgi:hypothetical protein
MVLKNILGSMDETFTEKVRSDFYFLLYIGIDHLIRINANSKSFRKAFLLEIIYL